MGGGANDTRERAGMTRYAIELYHPTSPLYLLIDLLEGNPPDRISPEDLYAGRYGRALSTPGTLTVIPYSQPEGPGSDWIHPPATGANRYGCFVEGCTQHPCANHADGWSVCNTHANSKPYQDKLAGSRNATYREDGQTDLGGGV